MSRNLLAKTKLDAFKAWMDSKGIEHRPGRGTFEVEQIKMKNGTWQCIFDRLKAPEHYTVPYPLEPMVIRFISESRLTPKDKP